MTGDQYFSAIKELGLSHTKAAEAIGVKRWASIAWRTGRRAVPRYVELSLRSIAYDRLAGDLVRREVDRIVATEAG